MLEIPGYTIKRKLGVGGMAVVYLATQDSLGREVALKVMEDSEKADSNQSERFIHEGHDLAALQHPNIVTIHDISHTSKHYYYAMEYLKYGGLHERMREGISIRDVFNIVLQIGSALECAHLNNIIHRDLKPDNILFRSPSTPILTDFGIAKNIEREIHLTKAGGMIGTPCYMSPEQCRGLNVNARSDQYSLCVLFFELITGYLPFDADESIAIAMKQISDPIPRLPDNLLALQWFIDIALDKEPSNRFTSVGEFCRVLEDMLTNESSLQAQLEIIIRRSPMDSDTIQGQISSNSLSLDSFNSELQSELMVSTLDSIPLPTEEEFWNRGGNLLKWAFILMLSVAVGFAGRYYYSNYYLAQIESNNERNIPLLIQRAEKQISVSHLLVPRGNNAYETLSKILAIEPKNKAALRMMEDAATSYQKRALDYIARKQFSKATRQIQRGFKFSKHHKGLRDAQRLLTKEQAKLMGI